MFLNHGPWGVMAGEGGVWLCAFKSLPLFFFFFFFLEDSKPKEFVIFFHAIPQSHYLPIIPLSRWHHGLLSMVIEFYLWHLTSAVIKLCVIFFISSVLFLCHFQVVLLLFFCSFARGFKFVGKHFAACSANRTKVLWIFVARYWLHRCFCLEKKKKKQNQWLCRGWYWELQVSGWNQEVPALCSLSSALFCL